MKDDWKREQVVYEVYLKSFQDSDGDGIGDLRGLISRLAYLRDLGVTAIWLTPFFPSPQEDNGYDIADYRGVDPSAGTMEDFDDLLKTAHGMGLRIILDMVFNHTSDRHPWFQASMRREGKYANYYHWRDGKQGREPNNWSSGFGASAWSWCPQRGQYYLHYYAEQMPDLNWEEPEIRRECMEVLRFWAERGVDGFRFDSINLLKKRVDFPDAHTPDPMAPGYCYDPDKIYNLPGIRDYITEMYDEVLGCYPLFTVGETSVTAPEEAAIYLGERGLDMVFNFQSVELPGPAWEEIRRICRDWYGLVERGGWLSQYLSNHDQPRQVSKFGNDGVWRERSAKLLGTLIHLLPGTPFLYQGEEIGMTNMRFSAIEDYDDLATRHHYWQRVAQGTAEKDALAAVAAVSRDNARTPMQWDDGAHAGFTSGTPWLRVNPNYKEINVRGQIADPDSVYTWYQKLIALRREERIVVCGSYREIPAPAQVFAFARELDGKAWEIYLNGNDDAIEFPLPVGRRILNNCGDAWADGLLPWQALVIERQVV